MTHLATRSSSGLRVWVADHAAVVGSTMGGQINQIDISTRRPFEPTQPGRIFKIADRFRNGGIFETIAPSSGRT